ncbi:MAG: hypothetical protein ACRC5T_08240, partial [Cetobacterium sp.]
MFDAVDKQRKIGFTETGVKEEYSFLKDGVIGGVKQGLETSANTMASQAYYATSVVQDALGLDSDYSKG